MNKKLQEERAKAAELLKYANSLQSKSFNLSDLKSDKTQYFDSPYSSKKFTSMTSESSASPSRSPRTRSRSPHQNQAGSSNVQADLEAYDRACELYQKKNHLQPPFKVGSLLKGSPFKPHEISARSTMKRPLPSSNKQLFQDSDFDEIMKTSESQAVRNKYRESMAMNRLSVMPRTADVSLRTTLNSSSSKATNNFWDAAEVSINSFTGRNYSAASENFEPAENMSEQLEQDRAAQEMEFATIPVPKTNTNESNWQERTMREPELSFGQLCRANLKDNIRDIYTKQSPSKNRPRVPLVEVSRNESVSSNHGSNKLSNTHLQKLIQNCDTPQAEENLLKFAKKINRVQDNAPDVLISKINDVMGSLNFDKIAELASKSRKTRAERDNDSTLQDTISTSGGSHQFNHQLSSEDALQRDFNAIPGRGTKRRSSNTSQETPRSALDKCMRSKSPTAQKEVNAALLKPKIVESGFKVPNSVFGSSTFTDSSKSVATSSNREYHTALSHQTSEKLSLPNYGLVRPEYVFTSPTSSRRSNERFSPNGSADGLLKRTVSQLSNGSEFHDDVLPIKVKKAHMKLSWPSVKLYQTVSKSITIQNGSSKKLSLRVRIQGVGFIVNPPDDVRMIPQEARTFEVRFCPNVVGPYRGQLIFELATNSKCMKTIPLFAFGGNAAIRISGIQKGPIGPAFMTMGEMKELNRTMEQIMTLTNRGTLPGFASLMFEKTKWSDFSLSKSVIIIPDQVRLDPGESVDVRVRFKATKDEACKIIKLNKEVTIVGEICIISGDEPTRLRIINAGDVVPEKFSQYLPKRFANDIEFRRELVLFNENLDQKKVEDIMEQVKSHEIALTVSRFVDETQIIAAELSMDDDTAMNFETFVDTNVNRTITNSENSFNESGFMLESKYFRVSPAKLIFSRSLDEPDNPKEIVVESTCSETMFVEAVSSMHDYVSAIKSCGSVAPGKKVNIKVYPKQRAFQRVAMGPISVSILIGNAKIEVPIKIVD